MIDPRAASLFAPPPPNYTLRGWSGVIELTPHGGVSCFDDSGKRALFKKCHLCTKGVSSHLICSRARHYPRSRRCWGQRATSVRPLVLTFGTTVCSLALECHASLGDVQYEFRSQWEAASFAPTLQRRQLGQRLANKARANRRVSPHSPNTLIRPAGQRINIDHAPSRVGDYLPQSRQSRNCWSAVPGQR
jgi:hypothetical protein